MSMEHKAFIFDFNAFLKLEKEIINAVKKSDTKPVYDFINKNLDECVSPYSEEELDENWQDELESEDLKELCDFALTCCYDITDDQGLSNIWEALLNIMKQLEWSFAAEYYILGNGVSYGDFDLDPGGMGTGFVEKNDIEKMNSDLIKNRGKFIEKLKTVNKMENKNDLEEGYEVLLSLYSDALNEKKGLLFTF